MVAADYADHGDRQPHPRLVLRQGRDLHRRGDPGGGPSRPSPRAPTSSTSAGSSRRAFWSTTTRNRVVPFIEWLRAAIDQLISVDTPPAPRWPGRPARPAPTSSTTPEAGHDPALPEVAAVRRRSGLLAHRRCGAADPAVPGQLRHHGDQVLDDVIAEVTAAAEHAAKVGVRRDGIPDRPDYDFGKATARTDAAAS